MAKMLLLCLAFYFGTLPAANHHESNCRAASIQSASPYAGQYTGEWTETRIGTGSFSDGESEHEGTWEISIASDGDITGTEIDKTSGTKGNVRGYIESSGLLNVNVKYKTTTTIKGVLEKTENRLVGTLTQYCDDAACGKIKITLKRK